MIKQVYKSNNDWLRLISFYRNDMPFDIFEGISAENRKIIYELATTIKSVLYKTDFNTVDDEIWEVNPSVGRSYEAVRHYSYADGLYFMPSTVEAMFIIAKVAVREGKLK